VLLRSVFSSRSTRGWVSQSQPQPDAQECDQAARRRSQGTGHIGQPRCDPSSFARHPRQAAPSHHGPAAAAGLQSSQSSSQKPMPDDVKRHLEGRFLLFRSRSALAASDGFSICTPFLPSCRQPATPSRRTRHPVRPVGRASTGGFPPAA